MLIEVDRDLHGKRKPGARLSDQPAEHDVVGERQRRRPDSDREVGLGGAGDAFAAAHRVQQNGGERNLQHNQADADQRRDDKTAHQQRAAFPASRRRRAPAP